MYMPCGIHISEVSLYRGSGDVQKSARLLFLIVLSVATLLELLLRTDDKIKAIMLKPNKASSIHCRLPLHLSYPSTILNL